MQIVLKDLYLTEGHFEYSKQVEYALGKMLAEKYSLTFEEGTSGYNPGYDFKLNNKLIEVKLTSRCKPLIEFGRYDSRPSGLMLTKSDYYLIISPGGSRGRFVGKIRMFNTGALKMEMVKQLSAGNTITTMVPSSNSPGSKSFTMDAKEVGHQWLGDCELLQDTRVEGFDIDVSCFTNRLNI